jgi:cytoskeletal protein CcmA (bactofilin family)
MRLTHKLGALTVAAAVIGGSIITAGVASAAPVTTSLTCSNQTQYATVSQNLNVPAGSWCLLWGVEVKGNVSAAGTLELFNGATLDKNLSINGGGLIAEDTSTNVSATTVKGNVSITGSPGAMGLYYMNMILQTNKLVIDGNFSYVGNSSSLMIYPAGLEVKGNFSYANNAYYNGVPIPFDPTNLKVDGHSSIS